jgi:hypothetical protein
MQQLDMVKPKHSQIPIVGPHPTPKMEKPTGGYEGHKARYGDFNLKDHDISLLENQEHIQEPMITEEEEHEIRQVASDINEKAFYGKIMRAKQIILDPQNADTYLSKLSPRSQEIASVMRELYKGFTE